MSRYERKTSTELKHVADRILQADRVIRTIPINRNSQKELRHRPNKSLSIYQSLMYIAHEPGEWNHNGDFHESNAGCGAAALTAVFSPDQVSPSFIGKSLRVLEMPCLSDESLDKNHLRLKPLRSRHDVARALQNPRTEGVLVLDLENGHVSAVVPSGFKKRGGQDPKRCYVVDTKPLHKSFPPVFSCSADDAADIIGKNGIAVLRRKPKIDQSPQDYFYRALQHAAAKKK